MEPQVVQLAPEEVAHLRSRFEALPEITSFRDIPELAARIAAYGMWREVGTVNDELARFIFDATTGEPVRRESLHADLVVWNELFGLRVSSTDSERLELRAASFYDVVHPTLSANGDGTLRALYIFPEIVDRIARAEGVDLVLVKPWGINSIFGGFDPTKGYYQTNFWEIENNDVLRFADLVRNGRLAFLGTHDLIAHIAGVNRRAFDALKVTADSLYRVVDAYFGGRKPTIAASIVPYTAVVVLDDLAQPPSYGSASHLRTLRALETQIAAGTIAPDVPVLLTKFPPSFQKVIVASRTPDAPGVEALVESMVHEIAGASLPA